MGKAEDIYCRQGSSWDGAEDCHLAASGRILCRLEETPRGFDYGYFLYCPEEYQKYEVPEHRSRWLGHDDHDVETDGSMPRTGLYSCLLVCHGLENGASSNADWVESLGHRSSPQVMLYWSASLISLVVGL